MKKLFLILSVLCMALCFGSASASAADKGGKKIFVEKFGQTYAFRDSSSLKDFLGVYDKMTAVDNVINDLNQASNLIPDINDLIDRINNDIYMHNVQEFDINDLRMKIHELNSTLCASRSDNEDLDNLVQRAYNKLDRAEDRLRYGAWDDFYMNIEDYFNKLRSDFSDCQGLVNEAQVKALTLFNEYKAQFDCFRPVKAPKKKANR